MALSGRHAIQPAWMLRFMRWIQRPLAPAGAARRYCSGQLVAAPSVLAAISGQDGLRGISRPSGTTLESLETRLTQYASAGNKGLRTRRPERWCWTHSVEPVRSSWSVA